MFRLWPVWEILTLSIFILYLVLHWQMKDVDPFLYWWWLPLRLWIFIHSGWYLVYNWYKNQKLKKELEDLENQNFKHGPHPTLVKKRKRGPGKRSK